uniref:U3 small nucleolar RNA-associated protein 11 n=1 Tax=Panagrolaimus sp. PS1159 TaxID=55785 RepID=A0AC35F6C7_9BILA
MSLRKLAKINQRTHRERPQPESRGTFGYLEHKKDWLQRAKDVSERKKKLKHLRSKVLEKNPDEYRHHMVRSGIGIDGIHRELDPDSDDETVLQKKFEGVKDLHYVRHKLSVERKKIEKLQSTLHLTDASVTPNQHIVFVDDEEEARNFDPAEYFNTDPEFLGRRFNRLTKDAVAKNAVIAQDKEQVKEIEKLRLAQYKELQLRIEREKELTIVLQKLELKQALENSKGSELKPKMEKKGTATRAAVYKWTYDRKK